MFKILYPFEGVIDEKTIRMAFCDAVMNGQIDWHVPPSGRENLIFIIKQLEDAGIYTFVNIR